MTFTLNSTHSSWVIERIKSKLWKGKEEITFLSKPMFDCVRAGSLKVLLQAILISIFVCFQVSIVYILYLYGECIPHDWVFSHLVQLGVNNTKTLGKNVQVCG